MLALAAAVLAGPEGTADAEPCPAARAWRATFGALRPRRECGAFLAATDGSMLAFSYGLFESDAPATIPFSFSVTMQKLGPESRSLELVIVGAVVLIREEAIGFYVPTDDVRFEKDGWQRLPGLHIHEEHRATVRQEAERVTLSIDGRAVATWAHHAPRPRGTVAFGFKGASGYRSWAAFRDVRVEAQ